MADVDFIMAMSCAPPALLGLYKYKRVEPVFHPFILSLLLSLFTETGIKLIKKSILPSSFYFPLANFYLLVNVLLFYFFFRAVKAVTPLYKKMFIAGIICFWFICCIINNPAKSFPYTASVVFSVYIFAGSVKLLSMQVFETRLNIYKNPLFYIAAGAVFFYAMSLFTTALGLSVTKNDSLEKYIYIADKIVNLIHYLLFLLAIIWMPQKKLQSA